MKRGRAREGNGEGRRKDGHGKGRGMRGVYRGGQWGGNVPLDVEFVASR